MLIFHVTPTEANKPVCPFTRLREAVYDLTLIAECGADGWNKKEWILLGDLMNTTTSAIPQCMMSKWGVVIW